MSKAARWAAAILGFLWMAFVYASFYLVQQQRPLGAENVRAIASLLGSVATAAAILIAAASVGHGICRRLGILTERVWEGLAWSAGIGLGVVANGVLALGLIGWLAPWAIAIWLAVLVALSLPDAAVMVRLLPQLRNLPRPGRALQAYLAVMGMLTLLLALAPPLGWDGLFYHLTLPKLYLVQGRIAPATDVPHQYFPGVMEMLYLGAMALEGDVAAKLLHLAYLPLSMGMVCLLARRHLGERHGWTALAVYASMPMVWLLGSWAYNDLALAFYQLGALYAFLNWRRGVKGRWLIVAGAFSGLALGLKYTAFVCPLALVAFVVWDRLRARVTAAKAVREVTSYGLAVVAVAAPWYVRNAILTGNPVYPFAYTLLGGRGWDAWRAAWYAQAGSGLGWNPGALLELPWTLTLGLRDANFYDGRAGPLLLLALPLLLAWSVGLWQSRRREASRPESAHSRPAAMGYMLVFAGLQYGFWTYGVIASSALFQARLLLPALTVLSVPVAYVYDELTALDLQSFSLRRVAGLSVALVLAANLCYHMLYTVRVGPLAVLVGAETRASFLERNLGVHYAAMAAINQRVPAEGKVLFLWEPRSYYCERAAQPDSILERWAWLRHLHGEADEIYGALMEEGYTHVLIHRAGLELAVQAKLNPIEQADLAALAAFEEQYLDLLADVGTAYELYALRPGVHGSE
jgi:hypothetical protein